MWRDVGFELVCGLTHVRGVNSTLNADSVRITKVYIKVMVT
jgi:hypothetical protein